jgi:hypothetical protein
MFTEYSLNTVYSILGLLSIILGLWIARKLLPTFIASIQIADGNDLFNKPWAKNVLWLALGALFSQSLNSVVILLVNIESVFLGTGKLGTIFGPVPIQVYSIYSILLKVVIYGIVFYLAKNYLSSPGQFKKIERIFIVATLAGLILGLVASIFDLINSIYVYNSLPGVQ